MYCGLFFFGHMQHKKKDLKVKCLCFLLRLLCNDPSSKYHRGTYTQFKENKTLRQLIDLCLTEFLQIHFSLHFDKQRFSFKVILASQAIL